MTVRVVRVRGRVRADMTPEVILSWVGVELGVGVGVGGRVHLVRLPGRQAFGLLGAPMPRLGLDGRSREAEVARDLGSGLGLGLGSGLGLGLGLGLVLGLGCKLRVT